MHKKTTLDARTKIGIMMITGCVVIILDSPSALLTGFLASLILIAVSKPTRRQLKFLFGILFFTTWGIVYSQGIFYNESPRTVLLTFISPEFPFLGKLTGGIRLYREGLFHGILQSIRFNTTLTVGCFIVWSTAPRELLIALGQLRVPAPLAFMVTTALHFLPGIANETAIVLRSQRLRGFRYLRLNLLTTARGILNSFRPILASNIRRATHLGESVESRGFSPDTAVTRTSLHTTKCRTLDVIILAGLATCLISIVILKTLYFCYAHGIYYASWLRHVYTFTREIL